MEVLVVVAILVVLAGIGIGVFYYLDTAKDRAAYAQIRNLEVAVETYRIANGSYPDNLHILTERQDDKPAPLSEQNIMDPWTREYQYEPTNLHPKTGKPRIYSQGANPGTSKQIANW
jgi:type II secretory pathway pseudopilin PulG